MPKKKSGFPYEVHPTPAKGKDGRNIVYARPARGLRMSIKGLDEYCAKHYTTRNGEVEFVLGQFLKAAAEVMAMGYRIETPIGTFVPKLKLRREITNADEVRNSDVMLDGVDYTPGKIWNKEIGKWLFNGFLRVDNPNVLEQLEDKEKLEQTLSNCLKRGYVTVSSFALHANLSHYTARRLLNEWTEGKNPRLLKTRMGHTDIYTET